MKKELPLKKICHKSQCHQWAETITLEGCWECGRIREYYFCKPHYAVTGFAHYCIRCNRSNTSELLTRVYERDGWVQQWL